LSWPGPNKREDARSGSPGETGATATLPLGRRTTGAASLAGDNGFDAFYDACYRRLVGQLFAVTGDLHEAEDVVQEAFVRAVARWNRLRNYDVPEAWVRRVAMNLAANGLRRARRRAALVARLGPPPEVPPMSVERLAVAEALGGLPVSYRQVLVLHHLVGLPLDEIARQLGQPVGAVKARLHRARSALAKLLAPAFGKEVRRAQR
jgi:RNA polymerase sigma-70 factor (ECF subfamily)